MGESGLNPRLNDTPLEPGTYRRKRLVKDVTVFPGAEFCRSMLRSRLSTYLSQESGSTWTQHLGVADAEIEIRVYLELTDQGTQSFVEDAYQKLYVTPYEPFEATVTVYPVASSRFSRLQATAADARKIGGDWILTPGIATELLMAVGDLGGGDAMMTFADRLAAADAVNTYSVSRVLLYLTDVDVDADAVKRRVESGEYFHQSIRNSALWSSELQALAADHHTLDNTTVFVNGMRLDKVTADAIHDAAVSVPTLKEITDIMDPEGLSFHKERIPPFTAGVNPTLADQSTDDTLTGYSTAIHTIK